MKYFKNKHNFLKKQSGQAVLEYVLLLFVIVTVCLGFMLGLAEGTRRFADNYFGAYFQCLLETGELPTLGSSGGGVSSSECDQDFQEFSLAAGRPPISTELSGASDGSSGITSNQTSAEDTSGSSGSEGASGSPIPLNSGESFGDSLNSRSQKVPVSANRKGTASKGNSQEPEGYMNNTSFDEESASSGRQAYVPILTGRYGESEDVEDKTSANLARENRDEDKDLRDIKRVPAQKAQDKKQNVEIDTGMSFPDFLRYLLILAVIVAIIVFFGGQVLQYQKSKD